MHIVNLVENTPGAPGCMTAHGLSLWVETCRHRLLMDFGPSDAAVRNAGILGIDLSTAEMAFLSHGHYDHSDGLSSFASVNATAPVYLRPEAVGSYYSGSAEMGTLHYIGMNPSLAAFSRFNFQEAGYWKLDEELSVFSGVSGRRHWPESNLRLSVQTGERLEQDSFAHEQYLVIKEESSAVLLSGCAHNGILNILDRFRELYGGCPTHVISGFHMMKSAPYTDKEKETIRSIARELCSLPCLFYTCHCTGPEAYDMMKEIMGDQLRYFPTGGELIL